MIEITRDETNGDLPDRIEPVGEHVAVWADTEHPSDGPCPDLLVCKTCNDEWPCGIVATVAAELERLAKNFQAIADFRGEVGDDDSDGCECESAGDCHRETAVTTWIRARFMLDQRAGNLRVKPPHVHGEKCMCDMGPMEVEGASECSSCGGHVDGPCGARCSVARREIVAARPPVREWSRGDMAVWRGRLAQVLTAPPMGVVEFIGSGDRYSVFMDELEPEPERKS